MKNRKSNFLMGAVTGIFFASSAVALLSGCGFKVNNSRSTIINANQSSGTGSGGGGTPVAQVSWSTPASGSWVNAKRSIEVAASGTCSQIGQPVAISEVTNSLVILAQPNCSNARIWQATLDVNTFADGDLNLRATHAGVSSDLSLRKDTQRPAAPSMATLVATNPAWNEVMVKATSVTAGDTVEFFSGNNCDYLVGRGTASGSSFETAAKLSRGSHTITARVLDPAGNVSECSTNSITVATGPNSSTFRLTPSENTTLSAAPNQTLLLSGSGGTPSYTFSIELESNTDSPATINPTSGVFTPSSQSGQTIVKVKDGADEQVYVTLRRVPIRVNDSVSASAVDSEGNIYLGGQFNAFNPRYLPSLGALRPDTGALRQDAEICNYAGFLEADAEVFAVAEYQTQYLLIGGLFSRYAGKPVKNLIRVNRKTCELDTAFSPYPSGPNGRVRALAVTTPSATGLFVGGDFLSYQIGNDAIPVKYLAKVNIATGGGGTALNTSFHSALYPGPSHEVYALKAITDSLFVGGAFSSYRGETKAGYLAKVSANTGALDLTFHYNWNPWVQNSTNPAFPTGSLITTLATSMNSNQLYVGGQISSYRNYTAKGFVRISMTNGDSDASIGATTQYAFDSEARVDAIAITGTTNTEVIYVGGRFTYDDPNNGRQTKHLAKLSHAGWLDTTFHTTTLPFLVDDSVSAIAVTSDSVYVSGSFASYRGTPTGKLIKLNPSSGGLDANFAPRINEAALVLLESTTSTSSQMQLKSLIVGGNFISHGGTAVPRLVKYNPRTGQLDSTFNSAVTTALGASTDAPYRITALALGSGSSADNLFVAFQKSDANRTPHLVKLSAASGIAASGFIAPPFSQGPIEHLVINGSALYLGGSFAITGSVPLIAKLNASTGARDSWFRTYFLTPTVQSGSLLKLQFSRTGSELYGLVSNLESYDATPLKHGILKLNPATGKLLPYPNGLPSSSIYQNAFEGLWVDRLVQDRVFIGGIFSDYPTSGNQNIFKWQGAQASAVLAQAPLPDSSVTQFAQRKEALFVGGMFQSPSKYLIKINSVTGVRDPAFSLGTGPNVYTDHLNVQGNFLILGGPFFSYRGQPAPFYINLSPASGDPLE